MSQFQNEFKIEGRVVGLERRSGKIPWCRVLVDCGESDQKYPVPMSLFRGYQNLRRGDVIRVTGRLYSNREDFLSTKVSAVEILSEAGATSRVQEVKDCYRPSEETLWGAA